MSRFIDLTGQVFGRLTVVSLDRMDKQAWWSCRCSCGNDHVVRGEYLRSGHTQSCGCFGREQARVKNTTHGMHESREYRIWCGMLRRCRNPNERYYPRYGGRGITVRERWEKSFEAFLADMGQAPSPKHTLDRIDVDQGYKPGNVRWATMKEQQRNRSNNRIICHNGESLTLNEWAERTGISRTTIWNRLRLGWSEDDALTITAGEAHLNPH